MPAQAPTTHNAAMLTIWHQAAISSTAIILHLAALSRLPPPAHPYPPPPTAQTLTREACVLSPPPLCAGVAWILPSPGLKFWKPTSPGQRFRVTIRRTGEASISFTS